MSPPATILVVDDDDGFRRLVVDILAGAGYRTIEAASGDEALQALVREPVDLVLTDQRMPGMDGLELTRRVRAATSPAAVVVMTAHGTIPRAVEAVRLGAADYITKPLESPAALRQLVRRVLGDRDGDDRAPDGEIITRDPAMLELLTVADRAAATAATVLIGGESGTGKELLARRIHARSPRAAGPFVAVNCAALPESLAESELFGHEKGAFTGAHAQRIGRFEQAGGGTLFLDEVGDLAEAVQAKLLRALEDRAVERVGGTGTIQVDIRLVAASNRSLRRAVETGSFRADLLYRLDVIHLELPPLRDRAGDLDLLVPELVRAISARLGLEPLPVSDEAMGCLRTHAWPGNVRELRNVLERALITADGGRIAASDVAALCGGGTAPPADPTASPAAAQSLSLEERERRAILEALERTGGHRERAAALLGISVRTLYNRLKRFGIQ